MKRLVNHTSRTRSGIIKLVKSSLIRSGKHISRKMNPNPCDLSVSSAYMSLSLPEVISDGQETPLILPQTRAGRSGDTLYIPGEQQLAGGKLIRTIADKV